MGSGGNLPVGPGIWGFISFLFLAVALWFLVRNMNSRLRRMAYRDREQAEADAQSRPGEGDVPDDAAPAGGAGTDGLGRDVGRDVGRGVGRDVGRDKAGTDQGEAPRP
jgi:hypothetical protein